MRKASFGAILALLLSSLAFAAVQDDGVTLTASGQGKAIVNAIGAKDVTFAEVPTGSVSGVSISTQGCMYGPSGVADGSFCDTAADTYTGTTQSIRGVSFSNAYKYFWISGTWTGSGTWSVKLFSGATASIPASFSFDLPSPSVGDSALYEHKLQKSGKIVRVSCSTDQGTATINLDLRQESSPNSSGTQVLSSPLVCTSNTAIATSLANPVYAANSPIALLISGTSGTPSVVRVHIASAQ